MFFFVNIHQDNQTEQLGLDVKSNFPIIFFADDSGT